MLKAASFILSCTIILLASPQMLRAGAITVWGDDTYGQVSNAPAGTGYTAIAAGTSTGYALDADGSISAWGSDDQLQVSSTPTGTGYTAIASNPFASFALAADGSIAA
ncbi:MAG: hypothetical protein WEB58_19670 [Planctomycetaceae bacterium]